MYNRNSDRMCSSNCAKNSSNSSSSCANNSNNSSSSSNSSSNGIGARCCRLPFLRRSLSSPTGQFTTLQPSNQPFGASELRIIYRWSNFRFDIMMSLVRLFLFQKTAVHKLRQKKAKARVVPNCITTVLLKTNLVAVLHVGMYTLLVNELISRIVRSFLCGVCLCLPEYVCGRRLIRKYMHTSGWHLRFQRKTRELETSTRPTLSPPFGTKNPDSEATLLQKNGRAVGEKRNACSQPQSAPLQQKQQPHLS